LEAKAEIFWRSENSILPEVSGRHPDVHEGDLKATMIYDPRYQGKAGGAESFPKGELTSTRIPEELQEGGSGGGDS